MPPSLFKHYERDWTLMMRKKEKPGEGFDWPCDGGGGGGSNPRNKTAGASPMNQTSFC